MSWLVPQLELRGAARRLRRRAVGSGLIVLLLAIGIAVGVLSARLLYGIAYQPLPYPEPERLVLVSQQAPGADIALPRIPLSEAGYLHFRDQTSAFAGFAAIHEREAQIEVAGELRRLDTVRTTSNLTHVLEVQPALGRWFSPDDTSPAAPPTAVVSYALWQSSLAGDRAALGSTLTIDGVAATIIGVMPRGFDFPWQGTSLWQPLEIDPAAPDSSGHYLRGVARLKPQVDLAQATADLDALLPSLSQKHPEQYSPQRIEEWQLGLVVKELSAEMTRSVLPLLRLLLVTSLLVVGVCCLNPALLLSARLLRRRAELATRVALGARRVDLARELTAEPLLLVSLASVLGAGLVRATTTVLLNAELPFRVPRLASTLSDPAGLLWLGPIALGAGLVLTLPLFTLVMQRPRSIAELHSQTSSRTGVTARALISGQVALIVVLVFGACLLWRSSGNILRTNLGYQAAADAQLLTFDLRLPPSRYPDEVSRRSFDSRLDAALTAMPGVHSIASSDSPLLSTSRNAYSFRIDRGEQQGKLEEAILGRGVTSEFFSTTGQPLLAGRSFDASESAREVVVNQAFAAKYTGEGNPELALELRVGTRIGDNEVWSQVAGVAANTLEPDTVAETEPIVYYPLTRGPGLSKIVQAEVSPTSLAAQVREAVAQIDPQLEIEGLRSFAQSVRLARWQAFFLEKLLLAGALLALVTGSVGLAGVALQAVESRMTEAGIRIAVGASARQAGLALTATLRAAAVIGIGIGVVACALLARRLATLSYGIPALDPVSLILASALALVTVSAAAALAISRIDASRPIEILHRD